MHTTARSPHDRFTAELDEFVTARYPSLLRTAYLLAGDRRAAEDLTQQALTRTCERGLGGTPIADLGGYVYRCMVNAHLSAHRRWWRREVPTDEFPERVQVTDIDRVADHDELARALSRLPARQRAALVLRFYDDLSEAQTATALGCPVGTAKTLTARGLARLRAELSSGDRATASTRSEEGTAPC